MRSGFTQGHVYLSVDTPLGKDVLLLQGFQGEEALSRPFQFTLEMNSDRLDLDFSQVVSQGAAVTLVLTTGEKRYLHGIVTRFVQAGTFGDFTRYIAELRPWLWLLTLTRDSRIFQNKAVPQILEQLFTEHGFTDFRLELQRSYTPREYCVQHQESTFDFVSRLLEDEGIFYFFEHSKDRHTLVLADDASAHAPCPGPGVAKVQGLQPSQGMDDAVTGCELEQQVVPDGYAQGDYSFITPSTRLLAKATGQQARFQQYEYPGHFTQQDVGEQRSRVRLESHEVRARTLRGQSRVRWFSSGHRFTLAEHDREDVNGDYVLRWVSHVATLEQYSNSFEAFPAATPFRPPRMTAPPVITGVQSARVVSESGEIWTDNYGRVKVRFHWDRENRNSCWMRVAQGWAGKGWGSFFLPHVGQEVLVTFLDGDPDRPLITGSVYNAEQRVPYPLPVEQTKSTVRGAPSGGGDPNELRFEDKKGQEELYLHARKDMRVTVENDSVREVQHDDTLKVHQGDRIVQIAQGGDSLTVAGDLQVKVNQKHALEAGQELHLKSTTVVIEATAGLTLKGPTGFITLDATGVAIKGPLVQLNTAGVALPGSGAHPKTPK